MRRRSSRRAPVRARAAGATARRPPRGGCGGVPGEPSTTSCARSRPSARRLAAPGAARGPWQGLMSRARCAAPPCGRALGGPCAPATAAAGTGRGAWVGLRSRVTVTGPAGLEPGAEAAGSGGRLGEPAAAGWLRCEAPLQPRPSCHRLTCWFQAGGYNPRCASWAARSLLRPARRPHSRQRLLVLGQGRAPTHPPGRTQMRETRQRAPPEGAMQARLPRGQPSSAAGSAPGDRRQRSPACAARAIRMRPARASRAARRASALATSAGGGPGSGRLRDRNPP